MAEVIMWRTTKTEAQTDSIRKKQQKLLPLTMKHMRNPPQDKINVVFKKEKYRWYFQAVWFAKRYCRRIKKEKTLATDTLQRCGPDRLLTGPFGRPLVRPSPCSAIVARSLSSTNSNGVQTGFSPCFFPTMGHSSKCQQVAPKCKKHIIYATYDKYNYLTIVK